LITMTSRRLPRPRDLRPLLRLRRPRFNPTARRLATAVTIEDLRTLAQRRTPRAAFDYTDGAAEGELSLARARQAFRDIEFHPSVLRDVSTVDTSVEVLGQTSALPFGIAPTGFTRLMHTAGERAGASAAGDADIPFALSTLGTTSIEDVAAANPGGRNWFQLYMWRDRDRSMAMVERAAAAGFEALVITVDVPVAGARLRDVRNGLTVPPTLTLRTVLDAARHPAWWFDFLTTEPLAFASLDRWPGTVAELLDTMFDPTITYDDLQWITQQWSGKIIVKGVQSLDDARRLAGLGVHAITLSNHGGRQLDRAPIPFHLLPEVVREVGQEAYLYGLMAGGRRGVDRTIAILADQIRRTMKLLGVRSVAELAPHHVTQLERLGPRARR
jgi:L-lactate dehydrogenase (cytochrome)